MLFSGDVQTPRVIKSIQQVSHELIPKHEILTEKEKEEILQIYDAVLDHLPKILITDPVAAMIGAKAGEVVKITRKSATAGVAVYYRAVVDK